MVEYLYDADGNRVGKGAITSFSCDTASNGFSLTNGYVLGPGGQQLSEYGASTAQPLHTNVWAAGQLIATDSLNQNPVALSFEFDDWLGDSSGVIDQTCPSLPYGDGRVDSVPAILSKSGQDAPGPLSGAHSRWAVGAVSWAPRFGAHLDLVLALGTGWKASFSPDSIQNGGASSLHPFRARLCQTERATST